MSRSLLIFLLMMSSLASFSTGALASNFPKPGELEPAVRFWTRVYTEVTTNQGYLHDAVNLSVVYKTLDIPVYADRATRDRLVKRETTAIQQALTALGAGKRSGLTQTESTVLSAWPKGTSAATFRNAAAEVRFQLGQADRFKEGFVRSGQWRPHIRRVLAMHNLPQELEVLPHVESSFNPNAYSKVAAAGMWQFMPGTARQYMRVDELIDERMDPFLATEGAAKLLKHNYEVAESWPLALTAYNHGLTGIMRAAKATGTKDIGVIVKKYQGPAFGFASRNFYASFLAALEVDTNAERYFGKVQQQTPMDYDSIAVREYVPVAAIAASAGVSLDELKAHNPALREQIWTGEKYIPRGFEVRIPRSRLGSPLQDLMAAIPDSMRFGFQKPDVLHKIRPGESLSAIAGRYNTSVSKLMALNGISSPHRIRAGQSLKLPGSIQVDASSTLAVAKASSPKVANTANHSGNYVIQSGDSIWSIARKFNISQTELVALNNINAKGAIKPGQTLRIPANTASGASGQQHYVIQPGDSLWGIARRFNLSQKQLLAWNGLKSGHLIQPGQRLRLVSN